jgi:2-hydroxymuconate-semialdehyde hydrolase
MQTQSNGYAMKEQSFSFRDIPVHYLEGGEGFPLLMIHGSGPGASTLGNWRLVLEPLAHRYHVHAMDLIGFGKSGRKSQPPYFDFPMWLDQCREMISRMPGERIGIIGHSLSGALALKLAASDARISKVMTTATIGTAFALNNASLRTWTFPRNRDELRAAAECLIHDKSLIDDAYLSNREAVLFSGDYERYFTEMFAGDKRRFIDEATLTAQELGKISCDVLMVHGRDDQGFPAEQLTFTVSRSIPQADVVLLGRCSHSVAFEHPQKFTALATGFFGGSPP